MARRRTMRLVMVTAVLGMLLAPTPMLPAQAQDTPGAVLLILDGSGSMNATDDSGRPLIDLAKEALTSITAVLPAGEVDVGLRVYGHRTSSADATAGCADSALVVPVGPLDPDRMNRAIDGVRPSGFTPIGLSLTEAADDLAAYDSATVILVSDGIDTCAPPDPCEVAAELASRRIRVNTVGFYLEDGSAARGQLACIADASGGDYREVDEGIDLAGVVGVLLREVPGLGELSIPFDGSTDRATAPLLPLSPDDATMYLQMSIAAGETRWLAVDVPPGHAIDLFADADPFVEAVIPEPGDAVVATIVDPDGRPVAVDGRFGRGRIDLGELIAVGIPYVRTISIGTQRLVAPYAEFLEEPWMAEGLEYQGYDEGSWNAEQRAKLRYERRGPLPSGRHLISVAWESSLDATTTFALAVTMPPTDAELFSTPASLAGSLDPTSPTPLPELPQYDPWLLPDPDLDPTAELYLEGPIRPGETRWYAVDVATEEILLVDALLAVPEGSRLADDELSIEVLDPLGQPATQPHADGTPATGTVSDLVRYPGPGFEPRPRVAAVARMPGPDSPPPGRYVVGITWDAAGTDPEATLELRIGTDQPEGMAMMTAPGPSQEPNGAPGPSTAEEEPAPTPEGAAPVAALVAIGALAALAAVGAVRLATRRR